MNEFNIDVHDMLQFFAESGAECTEGPGGFMIGGESIDPVAALREAFNTSAESYDENNVLVSSLMASAFYQVNIVEAQMEYPVLDELNLVA